MVSTDGADSAKDSAKDTTKDTTKDNVTTIQIVAPTATIDIESLPSEERYYTIEEFLESENASPDRGSDTSTLDTYNLNSMYDDISTLRKLSVTNTLVDMLFRSIVEKAKHIASFVVSSSQDSLDSQFLYLLEDYDGTLYNYVTETDIQIEHIRVLHTGGNAPLEVVATPVSSPSSTLTIPKTTITLNYPIRTLQRKYNKWTSRIVAANESFKAIGCVLVRYHEPRTVDVPRVRVINGLVNTCTIDSFDDIIALESRLIGYIGLLHTSIRPIDGALSALPPIASQVGERISNIVGIDNAIVNLLNIPVGYTIDMTSLLSYATTNPYILRTLEAMIVYGKDSTIASTLLATANMTISNAAVTKNLRLNAINSSYVGVFLRAIVERLFPAYVDIINKARYKTGVSILDDIPSAADKKIIMGEFEMLERQYEAKFANKCQHLRLLRAFRRAGADRSERLKILQPYMMKTHATTPGFIKCKVCKYDIMCQHVLDEHNMTAAGKSYQHILQHMQTNYMIGVRGAHAGVASGSYYCKVCYEKIFVYDDSSDETLDSNVMNDELRGMIYGEIMSIMRFVKFDHLINIKSVVNTIISSIYGYIAPIEKKLSKSKIQSVVLNKNRLRLHINIYVISYLIHMILFNTSSYSISLLDVSGKVVQPKPAPMLTSAISIIMKTKNYYIQTLTNIPNDFVKLELIRAYKEIAGVGAMVLKFSDRIRDFVSVATVDPYMSYLHKMGVLAGNMPALNVGEFLDYGTILKLFGKPLEDIVEYPYQYVKSVSVNNLATVLKKWPLTAYTANVVASYEAMLEYLAGEYWTYVVWGPDGTITDKFAKLYERNAQLHTREKQLHASRQYSNIRPIVTLSRGKRTLRYDGRDTSLGILYDGVGLPHKFDIGIDTAGVEHMIGAAIDGLSTGNGEVVPRFVDFKCSICGVLESERRSITGIEKILQTRLKINTFYDKYTHECPEDAVDLHEFDRGNSCKHCGVTIENIIMGKTQTFALTADAKTPLLVYFRKYEAAYDANVVGVGSDRKVMRFADKLQPQNELYSPPTAQKNNMALAAELKVDMWKIQNLGNFENFTVDDLKKFDKSKLLREDKIYDRATRLISYIGNLITIYNSVRYASTLLHPAKHTVEILSKAKVPPYKFKDLMSLPDILFDGKKYKDKTFSVWSTEVLNNKGTPALNDYLLDVFVELINEMLGISPASRWHTNMTVVREVALYTIHKVLVSNDIDAKAGEVNWSLFREILIKKTDSIIEGNALSAVGYDSNFDEDIEVIDENRFRAELEDNEQILPMENTFDIDDVDELDNEVVKLESD